MSNKSNKKKIVRVRRTLNTQRVSYRFSPAIKRALEEESRATLRSETAVLQIALRVALAHRLAPQDLPPAPED